MHDVYLNFLNNSMDDNVQILQIILHRAINHFELIADPDADDVIYHANMKCCKLILDCKPNMTMFKNRLGVFGFYFLVKSLTMLPWDEEDMFLELYIEVLLEIAKDDARPLLPQLPA